MKNNFLFVASLICLLSFSDAFAQRGWNKLDKSPLDVAYYRPKPAKKAEEGKKEKKEIKPVAKVYYSRPQLNGRKMLGAKVAYGKVWRLGANEATEITFYKNFKVGGKPVPAGTYTVYAIPEKDKWTVILNSKLDTWGAYSYSQKKDVARFDVPVETTKKPIDILSMAFNKKEGEKGFQWVIGWENTKVSIPITKGKAAKVK